MSATVEFKIVQTDFNDIVFDEIQTESTTSGISITFGNSRIFLKKFTYPKATLSNTDKGLILKLSDEQNVYFSFTLTEKEAIIKTSTLGEIQLFFFHHNDTLYGSDEFSNLLKIISKNDRPSLNLAGIMDIISIRPDPGFQTIFNGVQLLTENKILRIGADAFDTRPDKSFRELYAPGNTASTLDSALTSFIKLLEKEISSPEHILSSSEISSTLSGGLDSAVISHALLKLYPESNLIAVMADTKEQIQKKRQEAFISKFGGNLSVIEGNSVSLLSRERELFYLDPYVDPYAHFTRELSVANPQSLIFSGLGTDELLASSTHSDRVNIHTKRRHALEPFLTSYGREMVEDSLSRSHRVPTNTLMTPQNAFSHYSYAVSWRHCNAWGNSPLYSREILSFIYSLPADLKKDKELIKAYMAEYSFPKTFLNQQKTSYKEYFQNQMAALFENEFSNIMKNSVLFDTGLLNFDFLHTLHSLQAEKFDKVQYNFLYGIMKIELFLQKLGYNYDK